MKSPKCPIAFKSPKKYPISLGFKRYFAFLGLRYVFPNEVNVSLKLLKFISTPNETLASLLLFIYSTLPSESAINMFLESRLMSCPLAASPSK